ncbi:MAG: hypothetical protein QOE36_2910, partial [Gaiellaceae bacterium]|nr:hypothetical protein [Gaiellaceae bacterium]
VLDAGFPLAVYNRTPAKAEALVERGASLLSKPGEVLSEADVGVTMLAADEALEETVLGDGGILSGARPGTTLVDMSTVSVASSARVARAAAGAGVHYLRAPVSGNPGTVRAGDAAIVVSGDESAFKAVEPLLEAIGPRVHLVGDAEQARVVKLALQVMLAGTAELMAEALVLAEASGVARETLLEVMGASAAGSPFVKYKTGPLLRDDYDATFTTEMMLKDVELVLGLAGEQGVELPLTRGVRELLADAARDRYADLDFMSLYLQLRERAASGQ